MMGIMNIVHVGLYLSNEYRNPAAVSHDEGDNPTFTFESYDLSGPVQGGVGDDIPDYTLRIMSLAKG